MLEAGRRKINKRTKHDATNRHNIEEPDALLKDDRDKTERERERGNVRIRKYS